MAIKRAEKLCFSVTEKDKEDKRRSYNKIPFGSIMRNVLVSCGEIRKPFLFQMPRCASTCCSPGTCSPSMTTDLSASAILLRFFSSIHGSTSRHCAKLNARRVVIGGHSIFGWSSFLKPSVTPVARFWIIVRVMPHCWRARFEEPRGLTVTTLPS